MKVIHLISGLRAGGAENLVLALCRESLVQGEVAMQVASLSHINDIGYRFAESGIEVIWPASTRANRWQQAMSTIRSVISEKPDTIHAHLYYGALAAAFIKIVRPSTRVVFTLNNTRQPGFLKRLSLFVTMPFRNKDIVFPGCRPSWFQQRNSAAIANAIEMLPAASNTTKAEVFTCLFTGRLVPQKNPLFLIDLVKSLGPAFTFIVRVCGEGPLEADLKTAIAENGLSDRFEIAGFSNDIPFEMSRAHCLLLPSLWEGMPLAVLEAGAAGLPIIATPVGAVPVLLNQSNAYLSNLDGFANVVSSVFHDYAAAQKKAGLWQQKVLSEYTIGECYHKHLQVWSRGNP